MLDQIVIWWERKKKEREQLRLAKKHGKRAHPEGNHREQ